ncbi:MAG: hypothetical protein OXH15_09015 [Gammaproteobacteria bacterium]|nr:hypothetical protein [Gammaproteobacteria bacterium]
MSWATAIFLIVAMSLSIPLLKIWTNHQRKRRAHADVDEARVGSVETELDELRERVETLERIVTDERHRLEREFDQLDGTR